MNEERLKILDMLEQGKITADEAVQLLEALNKAARPGPEPRHFSGRHRRKRQSEWDNLAEEMETVQEEIQGHIRQARDTIRASMPRVKQAVRDAVPDIERIVRDATASIPDVGQIVRSALQTASDAVSNWTGPTDETRYPEQAERSISQTIPARPGARLALRAPRGHIHLETWDREEIQVDARILVPATTPEAARAHAENVRIDISQNPQVVHIQPQFPDRDEAGRIGPCRVDFRLCIPHKQDLDLRTAHGDIQIPEIEGAVVLRNRHGRTILKTATGNICAQQAHGPIQIGRAGADLTLEADHSSASIQTVVGAAAIRAQHGDLSLGHIEKNAQVAVSHGQFNLEKADGDVAIHIEHSPTTCHNIGGQLTARASHSPVQVEHTGGDVQISCAHGPLDLRNLGGGLIVQNAHGPIRVDRVAGRTWVKNSRAPIYLHRLGGEATAENAHGPIEAQAVAGRLVARTERGAIRILSPGAEVVAHAQHGDISICPNAPVHADYTLQTRNGKIEVTLPHGSSTDIRGLVRRGRIRTDLPLSVSEDTRRDQSVSGRLGEGGASLTAEVNGGDLILSSGD